MKDLLFQLLALGFIFTMLGCTSSATQTAEAMPTNIPSIDSPEIPLTPVEFTGVDFPKAKSHSLATGADGSLYLIYGQADSLFVSRSTDGGLTFSDAVLATGDMPVHVLPIEHPAIAAGDAGRIGIAWLEMPADFEGATIWYASSEDHGQTFKPGQLVTTELEGEVTMVQVVLDKEGNPILTWLNGSELKFSRSYDKGMSFSETLSIGDGACECCQPQALVLGDAIYISYRSLEPGNDKGDIRDIVMIHSEDGGNTFQPVTRVSDEHWYLPACPIAGPSLALHDDTFYIAWMDGRAEPAGTFTRGDIWLASSQDQGKTFSPNIRINMDTSMHNTLPSIAVGPGGRIHVTWEAQAAKNAYIYYTFSDDRGQSFAPPQVITDNTDSARGNPGKPVIAADSMGHITLAWLDRIGMRVASWIDTK